ncbi:MAG: YhcH/YjgK/YiaL family protein [Sporomusaceae bacterium]|nr:YhcH/YjgK/YiaL family protein [Sporomusaceae bacterium]
MIFGQLCNLEKEKNAVGGVLRQGLEYLAKTDFKSMPVGRYEIDDNMYALVQEYVTQPKADRKAERHEKYIDIQYVDQGEEAIGFALMAAENEVLEDKLAEKDAIFYKTVKDEVALVMPAGTYAIFFPADVHRPCCSSRQAETVRKVVMKIKVSALD